MRYTTRKPRSEDHYHYYEDAPIRHDVTVTDHEPTFTGLLDLNGDEIWREPRTIGFHHPLDDPEW